MNNLAKRRQKKKTVRVDRAWAGPGLHGPQKPGQSASDMEKQSGKVQPTMMTKQK